ncbi:MAG TPA: hypothetical protein VJ842_17050 [Pyrinomonadaceae bacterium]|nr:hypothetical protein [Pyrinomonadaceae bacterium]
MTRTEWLIWVLRYGDPKYRYKGIRSAIKFELYSLWWRAKGYKLTHWLDEKPKPAGKYILTKSLPRVAFKIFGKTYCFSEEMPVEYVPYTPELAAELQARTGKPVKVVEINYRLGMRADGF